MLSRKGLAGCGVLFTAFLTGCLLAACAGSVYSTVKMQVEREMDCQCDQKPKIELVSTGCSQSPDREAGCDQMQHTYQASCCGDKSLFDCLPEIREPNSFVTIEDRGRMPTKDVMWRCWKVRQADQRNPGESKHD